MSRKKVINKEEVVTDVVVEQVDDTVTDEVVAAESTNSTDGIKPDVDPITIVSSGKGKKLSPKNENHVFYDIGVDSDGVLYIRMSGNEGGGLHSKKWITLQSVFDLLDEQADRDFKSTTFKTLELGGSSNNCGFLAAVLRGDDLGLLAASDKSIFLHRLSGEYEANKKKLLALKPEK
ncbi:hypothetical protein A9Q98_03205 [Thalassotalea sp. 42_200_T64]|nr:hypothetical protein A9Q98_03205 [Thalassotalea sp. 42_200_T64]